MRLPTLLLAAAALLAPAAVAQKNAGKITLTDGSVLKDVEVVSEGLQDVEYKAGGRKATVASERVLRVEFGRKPKDVDQGDAAAKDEDYFDAIAQLQNYAQTADGKPDKAYPWAAAYARYRVVELYAILGEVGELAKAADQVVAKHPDSRYAPLAFVSKAQAQLDGGDAAGAKATAEAFGQFVEAKGLAGRWPLEQRLWAALTSGDTGKKLQDSLDGVVRSSSEYPTVKSRAEVGLGEALFSAKKFDEAESVFRAVTTAGRADARTLAAAWTGLGDCIYGRASSAAAEAKPALLREALKAYMRPVVVYPDESLFVSKAAFYAGRCFQELGDSESIDRAKRLYVFVITNFSGSKWEREARQFYGR